MNPIRRVPIQFVRRFQQSPHRNVSSSLVEPLEIIHCLQLRHDSLAVQRVVSHRTHEQEPRFSQREYVIPHDEPVTCSQHFAQQSLQQGPCVDAGRDAFFAEIIEKQGVGFQQHVLYHAEDIEWRQRMIFKPFLAAVQENEKAGLKREYRIFL